MAVLWITHDLALVAGWWTGWRSCTPGSIVERRRSATSSRRRSTPTRGACSRRCPQLAREHRRAASCRSTGRPRTCGRRPAVAPSRPGAPTRWTDAGRGAGADRRRDRAPRGLLADGGNCREPAPRGAATSRLHFAVRQAVSRRHRPRRSGRGRRQLRHRARARRSAWWARAAAASPPPGRPCCAWSTPTAGRSASTGEDLDGALRGGAARAAGASMQMVFQDPYALAQPAHDASARRSSGAARRSTASAPAARARRRGWPSCSTRSGSTRRRAQRYPHEFSGGQRQRIGDRAGAGHRARASSSPTSRSRRSTSRSRPRS